MKEMNFKNLIFVFLALFQVYDCQPTEIYENRLQITNINDKFVLYWKLVNDEILIEASVKTTGWVGIGISPNGGIKLTFYPRKKT